jgi:hypothetical protein
VVPSVLTARHSHQVPAEEVPQPSVLPGVVEGVPAQRAAENVCGYAGVRANMIPIVLGWVLLVTLMTVQPSLAR